MLTFHRFCSESTAPARAGTRGGRRGLYPESLFPVLRSGATCLFTTLGVTAACSGFPGRFMEPELQQRTDAPPTDSRVLRSSPREEPAAPPLHRQTSPAPRLLPEPPAPSPGPTSLPHPQRPARLEQAPPGTLQHDVNALNASL